MKRLFTLALVSLLCLTSLQAQKELRLKINHKLGSQAFALNQEATTPENIKFNVSRLQYYIGNFTIIHDGGQSTTINEKWFLVDASQPLSEKLTELTITNLESIRFHIGVESSYNHLDPAGYPNGHPLAPQWPSMHWGWQAGYRFVAIEGKGGANVSEGYEVHALGDENYFESKLQTAGYAGAGNEWIIELNADYTQCFKDIDPGKGLIIHGEDWEAKTLMENFNRYVFTSSEGNKTELSVEPIAELEAKIFPNPSQGKVKIQVENATLQAVTVDLYDINGKQLQTQTGIDNEFRITHEIKGVYFIRIRKDDGSAKTIKWIVQ